MFTYNSGIVSKIYYNGKLLGSLRNKQDESEVLIEGSNEAVDSAFILGQEPDTIRGGYNAEQALSGDITQLNVWDHVLEELAISEMASCEAFPKGNIVSWDKNLWKINKAMIQNLEELTTLCNKNMKLMVFPERQPLEGAKSLCTVHGGNLFTPHSMEQNEEFLNIILKYKDECLENKNGLVAWLGLEKRKGSWYEINYETETRILTSNYSNWGAGNGGYEKACAFLQADGKWIVGKKSCFSHQFCPVCQIIGTPIYTIKGLCSVTSANYNYYLELNERGEIFYEAYKSTDKSITNKNGTWIIQSSVDSKNDFSMKLDNSSSSIIGRNMWELRDANCNIKKKTLLSLTLSVCKFGQEFTCNSGHCVQIFQRCNHKKNCFDGSDEENCDLVKIPMSYRKINAPDSKDSNNLTTSINILNIDMIDSVNMLVGLTIEVKIKWRDPRLEFVHLFDKKEDIGISKKLSLKMVGKLWLPLKHVIHDNAVIGKIEKDEKLIVGIKALSVPKPDDISINLEEISFDGSKNDLVMVQRFKLTYRCNFNVLYFPFDNQSCDFIMKINADNNGSLEFVEDNPAIQYNGPLVLNEFEVYAFKTSTFKSENETSFVFKMDFGRLYFEQLSSTFFQTFLLTLLAYLTLYIEDGNFSDRFMGSITALLVFASILASLRNGMPKTSYFKYIDLWFIWNITNIFLITVFHVILDRILKQKGFLGKIMNKAAKFIIFPCINILFCITYFYLVTQH